MGDGLNIRIRRIINEETKKTVILPLDHGVTCGVLKGLENMKECIQAGITGGADALVIHKGMFSLVEETRGKLPGLIMHLSGSTQLASSVHHKVLIGTVEEALIRGADGVSCHINLGNEYEGTMLADLGKISADCAKYRLPLLVMIYVRGRYAPSGNSSDHVLVHAVRVAGELGASIIKTSMPSSPKIMEYIAKISPVPVIVAGGSKSDNPLEFLRNLYQALQNGIAGVAAGRNVFQQENPVIFLKAITFMVHKNLSPDEAMILAREEPI